MDNMQILYEVLDSLKHILQYPGQVKISLSQL